MRFTLLADTGVDWDIVELDKYTVTYPRAFQLKNDRLTFTDSADAFTVSGLQTKDAVVYRYEKGALSRLTSLTYTGSAAPYSVTFAGTPNPATYFIVGSSGLYKSAATPTPFAQDLTTGSASLLIISHPDFIAGLAPLVQARQAQGYTVKVVNVEDVYTKYNFGVVDPIAIQRYIRIAAEKLGVQYVLLVGGDTYDYFDYLGLGSISFIPSIYGSTGVDVNFAPLDPLYGDIDLDRIPDIPVGRFPVRTSAELQMVIDKTLAYENKNGTRTAVLAADQLDTYASYTFSEDSDAFAGGLAGWTVDRAYIDSLGLNGARTMLLNSLNNGVDLTSYIGHSGPWDWTFLGLFSGTDAAALTNYNNPTIVTQWGCWNTYYVDPEYNTLSHEFMVAGNQGAAAVLGSTTITFASSEKTLGDRMMPLLVQPGKSIGYAMVDAKQAIRLSGLTDVILGWTILGDPTLKVQP